MTLVFLAGALRHEAVLAQVLEQKSVPTTAKALGFAERVQDPAQHVALVAAEAGAVLGQVQTVSDSALARLAHYCGCFGAVAAMVPVELADGTRTQATAFVAPVTGHAVQEPPIVAPIAARMAAEIMAFFGRKTPEEIQKSLYSMRLRAASWVALQAGADDPERDLDADVVVHAHRREYMNFFAMEEMDLQYRRFDGTLSPVINRGASMVGQAAVVLPYDPIRDAVLLIEQFRIAPYFMGAKQPWVWEPPAGLIDPGETPEQAARREAKEEAGLTVGHVDYVGGLYSSTGALGEIVHCFVGLADVSSIEGGGGVPGEGEDIRSKVMSFHEFMEAIDGNTFVDMPLVTTALWLARHRDRLRALV